MPNAALPIVKVTVLALPVIPAAYKPLVGWAFDLALAALDDVLRRRGENHSLPRAVAAEHALPGSAR